MFHVVEVDDIFVAFSCGEGGVEIERDFDELADGRREAFHFGGNFSGGCGDEIFAEGLYFGFVSVAAGFEGVLEFGRDFFSVEAFEVEDLNGGAEAVPVAGGTGEVVNKVGIGVETFSAEDFADGVAVGAGKTNDALSLLEGEIFDEVEPADTVGEGESFWVFVERCEGIEPIARVRAALSELVEFDN